MNLLDIIEARRNPSQNIKKEGHSAAVEFLNTIPKSELKYWGVSMRSIEKIGINPRSDYNTPLGIYFYPAEYYLDKKENGGGLPFQDDAQYIYIFEINTEDMLYISDVDDSQFGEEVRKLYNLSSKLSTDYPIINKSTLDNELGRIIARAPAESKVKTYGGYLWFILWDLSNILTQRLRKPGRVKESAVIWNKLLRLMNYDGVIDTGSGIIHVSEPIQGLLCSSRYITNTHVFRNEDDWNFSNIQKLSRQPQKYRNDDILKSLLSVKAISPDEFIKLVITNTQGTTFPNEKLAKMLAIRVMNIIQKNPNVLTNISLFDLNSVGMRLLPYSVDVRRKFIETIISAEWTELSPLVQEAISVLESKTHKLSKNTVILLKHFGYTRWNEIQQRIALLHRILNNSYALNDATRKINSVIEDLLNYVNN